MKNRVVLALSLFIVLVAAANLFPTHAQKMTEGAQTQVGNGGPPLTNPLKVALLKWYLANQVPTSFLVGRHPYGVVFDGANIWTANNADATVSKVRACDGTILGTFGVGSGPIGLVFDGANIWVSSNNGSSVTKLRGSDGKTLGVFQVGKNPFWMAFDGQNVWVANSGDGTVSVLRASDGKALNSINTGGAIAAAFDGTYIWISTYTTTVVRLRQDGSNAGTFTVGHNPLGIAFDGANLWVANRGDATITKLRASDGTILGTFGTIGAPYGVAFDGQNIWATLPDAASAVEMRASDGRIIYTPYAGSGAGGIAFDGVNMWAGATLDTIVAKL